MVEELLGQEHVQALGFGIPATIDQQRGRAVTAPNLPLEDFPFRERMAERFRLPIAIDNDANAAAIAEWAVGAGRGTRNMVMLTLGTGIGGGLILGGRPYRGSVGAAAELGHMVIQHDGPRCQGVCTGRGHLEALASGTAAGKVAREVLGPEADAHALVREAQAGNDSARTALAEIGRRLGSGIGSLVNIFDPEVVVIGGGFAAAGELIFGPALEVVQREALEPARDRVRIVPAQLGPEAGLVGAAFVAFEALGA
jgi:glucokinase